MICNNSRYKLLDLNITQYWKEKNIPDHDFPSSFDLSSPNLQFVDMAKSMGVPAARIECAEEIPGVLDQALATDGPFLIDLVLTKHTDDHKPGCKCGQ